MRAEIGPGPRFWAFFISDFPPHKFQEQKDDRQQEDADHQRTSLGPVQKLVRFLARQESVIPLWQDAVLSQTELAYLLLGDFDTGKFLEMRWLSTVSPVVVTVSLMSLRISG